MQEFKRAIRLKGELFNINSFNKAKKAILNNTNKITIPAPQKKDIKELEAELTELQEKRVKSITKRVKRKREQQSIKSLPLPTRKSRLNKRIKKNNDDMNIVKSKLEQHLLNKNINELDFKPFYKALNVRKRVCLDIF